MGTPRRYWETDLGLSRDIAALGTPAVTVVFRPGITGEPGAGLEAGPSLHYPHPARILFPALPIVFQEDTGWTEPEEEHSLENTNPFSCFPLHLLAKTQNLYIFFFW